MPSTTSSSLSSPEPSSTVITPSLPTFSIASAMVLPMDSSALAEIVPTWAMALESLQGKTIAEDGEGRQGGRDHGRGGLGTGQRAGSGRGHAVRPRLPLAVLHQQPAEPDRRAGKAGDPAGRQEDLQHP